MTDQNGDAALQNAVDKNFTAFLQMLPELLQSHPNKFALLRNEKVIEFFDTARDAMIHGAERFDDGLYSVQEVTDTKADLGYFSHAVHHLPV